MRLLLFPLLLSLAFAARENGTPKEKVWPRPRGHIFFLGRPVDGGFLGHSSEDYRAEARLRSVEALPTAGPLPGNPHVSINWFNQTLDHMDGTSTKTFMQKYWVNNQFYKKGGPVFIQIGGEGPTSRHWIDINEGVPDYLKNAKKFGAMAVQLEHRYYGDTWPTADTSTPNLRWLSSRQALEDIATFIKAFPAIQGLPSNTKFVTFGGSYSGALSAWFRLKYPHLAIGAIATSAPVQAQVDFKQYFGVVEASLNSYSSDCANNIKLVFNQLRSMAQTTSGRQTMAQLFNFCPNTNFNWNNPNDTANMWSNLAGNFAGVVQYSQDNRGIYATQVTIPKVCQLMTDISQPSLLRRFANVNSMMMNAYGQPCLDNSYADLINYYRATSFKSGNLAGRMWTWQTCTEFGYYQDSGSTLQPFFGFPLPWILQQCQDIFGAALTPAAISRAIAQTNLYYGARNFKGTRVVFPNGSVDPWHALGILSAPSATCPAAYIMGTAHCANMYPPSPRDSPQLNAARNLITASLQQWINNPM